MTSQELNERISKILASPMAYPPFAKHEALFKGNNVRCKLLRAKLSKNDRGDPQIWVEGVVTSTGRIAENRRSEDNPEGWETLLFGEEVDKNGDFPTLGYGDATGYRFTWAGTLLPVTEGKEVSQAEIAVNQLRFFGWRANRANKDAGKTGDTFDDFIPAEGQDYVPAADLGMDAELIWGTDLNIWTSSNGNTQSNIRLLPSPRLADVRVTKAESQTLSTRFGSLLQATAQGQRYDSRKAGQGVVKGSTGAAGKKGAAAGAGSAGAQSGAQSGASGKQLCGRLCGADNEPCTQEPGHGGDCTPPPF